MGLLLGTRDLGLAVNWRFGFVGHGTRTESTHGVVYLDVGGQLSPGVLDHHQGAMDDHGGSTADLIVQRPELVYNHLMEPWLRRRDETGIPAGTTFTPTIITHHGPDWDGVVSSFLVMRLIEDGEVPQYAGALAEYVREVDQGRYRVERKKADALHAPHLGYLAIQNLDGLRSEGQLRLGHAFVDRVLRDLRAARQEKGGLLFSATDFHPGSAGVSGWRDDPQFADAVALLDADPAKFDEDVDDAVELCIPLPAADGGALIDVRTFASPAPTRSKLNKYWVRDAGYQYFVCPIDHRSAVDRPQGVFSRVVLSLDPTWKHDGRRPTLRGLGYALELEETRLRSASNKDADQRTGEPRYPDGACDNADPWYDGRDHEWTIVDTPRVGTVIPYADIQRIATTSPFWETPLESGTVVLVWVSLEQSAPVSVPPSATAPPYFEGMCDTMTEFFDHSKLVQERSRLLATGMPVVCEEQRYFPAQTAPTFRVFRIGTPDTPCTVEALVEAKRVIVKMMNNRAPDYSFSRVRIGGHVPDAQALERKLRMLGDGDLAPMPGDYDGQSLLLFNNRSLVVRESAPRLETSLADQDLEILLYVAFLNESLIAFSRKIGKKVPHGEPISDIDTGELRADLLRFQTKYFQLEVSRTARGRLVFYHLADSLRLGEHYREVLAEADRLGEVEEQLAEARRARAERVMEIVLYIVAVVGVYQTVIAFWTLDWSKPLKVLLIGCAAIFGLALVGLAWILCLGKGKKKRG